MAYPVKLWGGKSHLIKKNLHKKDIKNSKGGWRANLKSFTGINQENLHKDFILGNNIVVVL